MFWYNTNQAKAVEPSARGDGPKKYSTKGTYGLKKCFDPGLENAGLDVILVHGLTGNRENTWTDKDSGVLWPEELLPDDLPKARIFTYGYDADILHFWEMSSQSRIGNHAQTLLNTVSQVRERSETNDRPIIFVAHSLGGLVVEDVLLASKNSAEPHLQRVLECTRGIVFMGTPQCGSDLANWGSVCGNMTNMLKKTNLSLVDVLKPDSEVLARIQQEFHTMIRARLDAGRPSIKITCFYEDLPVRGIGEIVPKHSAILPAYTSIAIHADHMSMTKFADPEDAGYQAVSNELWRWAKEIASTPSACTVAPQRPLGSTQDQRSAQRFSTLSLSMSSDQQREQRWQLLEEPGDRVHQGGAVISGGVNNAGKNYMGQSFNLGSGSMLNFS